MIQQKENVTFQEDEMDKEFFGQDLTSIRNKAKTDKPKSSIQ